MGSQSFDCKNKRDEKMKRIISALLCAIMAFASFVGCSNSNKTNTVSSQENSSASTVTSSVVSEDNSSEQVSSETVSSDVASSSTVQSTQQTSSQPTMAELYGEVSATVGPYTIYDIYNAKGLSNKRVGHSFGVAKNGKPHSISVNYQKYFTENPQYNALVYDTVSEDKCMYLTFDCGYEYKQLTGEILDTLKEKNVKAAFFCTLSYIKKNPKLVRRMIDEGHIVGNHSASHPDFSTISRKKQAEEVYKFEEYLQKTYNYNSPYFRYPSGAYSENSLELVSSMGYRQIFWSLAYSDWDTEDQKGADYAYDTVTARYHSGAVILLHAVSKDNADALGRMIDKATTDGYTFKSLDEYYK